MCVYVCVCSCVRVFYNICCMYIYNIHNYILQYIKAAKGRSENLRLGVFDNMPQGGCLRPNFQDYKAPKCLDLETNGSESTQGVR